MWCVVAALALPTLLTGCALFGPRAKTQGAGGVPVEATAGIDPDVTPFVLEVLEEVNDGKKLIIKGRLIPKATKPASEVVVRLSALDKAGEERVSFHNMKDVLGGSAAEKQGPLALEKGVAQPFTLSMPLKGISSYQLQVLWGKDAAPFSPADTTPAEQNQPKQFIALRNLEVHRVPAESCSSPNECVVRFTITGEMVNSGAATIKDVVIVAGFAPSDALDLDRQILENEKRVEVPNLRLAPGASQRFKLSLDKAVPVSTVVAPQPVVRIASFRSE
jgi:hypothetical protein